jgi:hypothetical protein
VQVLLDCHPPHVQPDRPRMRIEATPPVIRVEGIRIDTPRPVHEALSHSARLQLADQRLRSHQGVLGTPVEPPLQAIRPFDGNGEALPEVFREPRMEAGREVEPLAAQPLTDPDSERTFRGNVDGVRTERDQAIDRPPRVPRQPYLRIRRHGHRLVAVGAMTRTAAPSDSRCRTSRERVWTTPLVCGCHASVTRASRVTRSPSNPGVSVSDMRHWNRPRGAHVKERRWRRDDSGPSNWVSGDSARVVAQKPSMS